ncbi:hypothetical protein GmHk_01G002722 [Glycine max]|nr:hypothetical protein GmHk_01G002722 [Glycine max]
MQQGSLEPLLAEAWGLIKAMKWVQSLGLQRVIFELDCKAEVDKLHSKVFVSLSLSFARKQANLIAHKLAKTLKFHVGIHIFDCIPLSVLSSSYSNDIILFFL